MIEASVDKYNSIGIIGCELFAHKVTKVYSHAPAEILKVGDKIINVLDEFGRSEIDGEPGTVVRLKVKRDGKTLIFFLRRVPVQELHNPYLNQYFGVKE